MAYDPDLAQRIRTILPKDGTVREVSTFGGRAFIISGKMAAVASGRGGLMVRVDADKSSALVSLPGARLVEMRGRALHGWLRVPSTEVATDHELADWLRRSAATGRRRREN